MMLGPYLGILKAISIVGMVLGLIWFGHHLGAKGVQAEWDAAELKRSEAEKVAVLNRVSENQEIFKRQEIDTAKLTKAHDDALTKTRAARVAAPRLSVPVAVCSSTAGSAETKSASSSDGGNTATRMVSPATQRDFDALEDRIETVFASCRTAQQFIINNGLAP